MRFVVYMAGTSLTVVTAGTRNARLSLRRYWGLLVILALARCATRNDTIVKAEDDVVNVAGQ
jgi:hypothetical protein